MKMAKICLKMMLFALFCNKMDPISITAAVLNVAVMVSPMDVNPGGLPGMRMAVEVQRPHSARVSGRIISVSRSPAAGTSGPRKNQARPIALAHEDHHGRLESASVPLHRIAKTNRIHLKSTTAGTGRKLASVGTRAGSKSLRISHGRVHRKSEGSMGKRAVASAASRRGMKSGGTHRLTGSTLVAVESTGLRAAASMRSASSAPGPRKRVEFLRDNFAGRIGHEGVVPQEGKRPARVSTLKAASIIAITGALSIHHGGRRRIAAAGAGGLQVPTPARGLAGNAAGDITRRMERAGGSSSEKSSYGGPMLERPMPTFRTFSVAVGLSAGALLVRSHGASHAAGQGDAWSGRGVAFIRGDVAGRIPLNRLGHFTTTGSSAKGPPLAPLLI